jgi:hypothetical protein
MEPMESNTIRNLAAADFSRARGQAAFSKIMNFMNVDRDKLLSFYDVKDIL